MPILYFLFFPTSLIILHLELNTDEKHPKQIPGPWSGIPVNMSSYDDRPSPCIRGEPPFFLWQCVSCYCLHTENHLPHSRHTSEHTKVDRRPVYRGGKVRSTARSI